MRLAFSGLKAGILAQLLFLVIAAMLLINIVMLNLSQRNLLQTRAEAGKIVLRALSMTIGPLLELDEMPLSDVLEDAGIKEGLEDLLSEAGYTGLAIVDTRENLSFSADPAGDDQRTLINLARISLQESGISVNYRGSTWAVLWLGMKDISLSGPLTYRGKLIGAASINSPLDPVYNTLRRSERLVILYIILDAVILTMVGIYLLSRLVINPIHRLLKMTENYRDGEILPPVSEYPGNEMGNLSRSLGIMLKRLDENKKELRQHIRSLEKANRDLEQAQDEIIRSEKLASVGRLAAGIAHEIGNPLGIILGYLELIRREDIPGEEKKDFINRIESEITRINMIIRKLLDFSRPSTGNIEEYSVHEIITDTADMMTPHPLLEGIEIRLELRATRDTVLADPGQLQQVFLNIIMNAADVLKEGACAPCSGVILIKTSDRGDSVEIDFTDNGPGIEEEKIQHIFDPFYTTKDPGKGTGLGLSVSYMIIDSRGGTIRAESVKGRTSIIITLPLHAGREQGDAE